MGLTWKTPPYTSSLCHLNVGSAPVYEHFTASICKPTLQGTDSGAWENSETAEGLNFATHGQDGGWYIAGDFVLVEPSPPHHRG